MSEAKVKNYTEAMETAIVERYEAAPTVETVEALAAEFSKTKRSIVAKLSNLGVYKAKERTTKTGAPVVRKADLVAQISEALGVTVTTLEKASKQDLEAVAKVTAAWVAKEEAAEAAAEAQ